LGHAYRTKGQLEKALSAFKHALSLNPNLEETRLGLGQVYIEMGDKQKAIQEYEVLKELDQELAGELYSMLQESKGMEVMTASKQ